jgi:hypothetical protein
VRSQNTPDRERFEQLLRELRADGLAAHAWVCWSIGVTARRSCEAERWTQLLLSQSPYNLSE